MGFLKSVKKKLYGGAAKTKAHLKGIKKKVTGMTKPARSKAAGNMLGGSSEQGGGGGSMGRLRSAGFGTVGYTEEK